MHVRFLAPYRPGSVGGGPRLRNRPALSALVACAALALSSCGGEEEGIGFGSVGFVEGFFGAVAADEPNAVLVGRDILSSGGTAADAAVSVAFTLAVTLPSRASLGSGGVCLVHDPATGSTEALDFIPVAGTPDNPRADRPSSIPALTRGMVAMHARYGELDWRALLRPAEDLARFGHRLPRAFSKDLNRAAKLLFVDPEARRVFGRGGGGAPIGENERYRQLDLATLLGQLRINGAGVMYNGPIAKKIVDGVAAAGGTLTVTDLRDWLPQWRATFIQPYERNFVPYELHVAPLPAAGGILAGQMIGMLREDDRYVEADQAERLHLLAAVGQRAYAGRAGWLKDDFTAVDPLENLLDEEILADLMQGFDPNRAIASAALNPPPVRIRENPAAASFVVVDRRGGAVACTLTMYNLFGTGRVVPNTGIVLAAAPDGGSRNPLPLGPVMVVRPGNFHFHFAIAGSGGVAAPTAVANVAARTLLAGEPARDAVDAPRVHHGSMPDQVVVEEAIGAEAEAALSALGYAVSTAPRFGQVNVIHCPSDLPPSEADIPVVCSASGDRRGYGMAVQAD